MPFYTGRNGKLRLSGGVVSKVRDWTLDTSVTMLDTTTLGDTASNFTPGLSSATGSATVMYFNGETTDVTDLLQRITKTGAITDNDEVNLTFEVGSDQAFVADAFINSVSITSSTDELTTASFNFTINGPLTSVTLTGNSNI
jgi:hypothetical protein